MMCTQRQVTKTNPNEDVKYERWAALCIYIMASSDGNSNDDVKNERYRDVLYIHIASSNEYSDDHVKVARLIMT